MQAEMKQAYQKSGLAPKKDSKTMQTGGGAGGLSGFWKFAVLFSFLVNAILVLVLLVVVGLIFQIKNGIAAPLIGGLYDNFVLMDKARIVAGSTRRTRFHDFRLTEAEKLQGYALMCCSTALSDVVIDTGRQSARALLRHLLPQLPEQCKLSA